MTKDDVMILANQTAGQHWMDEAHIQRFAVVLISAEREQCAKVCDEQAQRSEASMLKAKSSKALDVYSGAWQTAMWMASAIRARSQK